MMRTKAEKLDRIFLWILLTGGLISLLFYGLTSFLTKPTVETITTHSALSNKNSASQEINYQPPKNK